MMYDLVALKNYEHHLNEFGTDLGIAEFVKLDLQTQCLIAERWQAQQDYKTDVNLAKLNGEWT